VTHLLGPGLRGFLVAAVLGAVMSTISSIANATASVFTVDIYKRWLRPTAGERDLLRTGRLAGAATLCLAYPLTMVALDYRYIFTYSQNAWAILAIPIMLAFTLGALWRRATARAASAAFLFVLPFVLVPFLFGNSEDSWLALPWVEGKVHLFVFAFYLWIATGALMVIASCLSRAPEPSVVEACVWRPGKFRAEAGEGAASLRWYKRVGFWCAVAGLMYLAIYWKFR
jgi:SSS family solute:Na+ symporter